MTALLAYIDTGTAIGLLWHRVTRRVASLLPSRATLIEAGSITPHARMMTPEDAARLAFWLVFSILGAGWALALILGE